MKPSELNELRNRLGGSFDAGQQKRKRREAKARSLTASGRLFSEACRAHGLPAPVAEYPFGESLGREWRFDYVLEGWLAVEVQGGLHTGGRHVRGAALEQEYEKLNAAVILGYSVLFFTPAQVQSGAAFAVIKQALEGRE